MEQNDTGSVAKYTEEMSAFDAVMARQGSSEGMPIEAWKDISEEEVRVYRFPGDNSIAINNPVALAINSRGSHRIIDSEGISHYIPAGWVLLSWKVKAGRPYFRF